MELHKTLTLDPSSSTQNTTPTLTSVQSQHAPMAIPISQLAMKPMIVGYNGLNGIAGLNGISHGLNGLSVPIMESVAAANQKNLTTKMRVGLTSVRAEPKFSPYWWPGVDGGCCTYVDFFFFVDIILFFHPCFFKAKLCRKLYNIRFRTFNAKKFKQLMSFFPHGFRVFVCVAVFFSCNLVGFPLEMHHISKTHIMEKRHEINTSKAPVFLFVLRISFMRSTVAANSFKPIFVRSVQVKYISVLTFIWDSLAAHSLARY